MKKVLAVVLVMCMCAGLCACGNEITGQGFELVDDDGTFVRYHLKCTECGHVYSAMHEILLPVGETFEADVNCDLCFKPIYVSISRR